MKPSVREPRCSRLPAFRCAVFLAGALAGATSALAAGNETQVALASSDLTQLSLDDLMKIEVTSVSKNAEPVAQAPAAIYVLTGDDIRRSGARTLAEALRRVPGLQVARTNDGVQTYAVSARGFNAGSSNKLEVLLDGRSVYTPLFSGVFWDAFETYLPDIDRIEVIRGPGATLWGANAVNGVINVITKPASATLGTRVKIGGGDAERAFIGARTGFGVGDFGDMRLYAKTLDRHDGTLADGSPAQSYLRMRQAGLRADLHDDSESNQYSVWGDAYTGSRASEFGKIEFNGSNVMGRWTHVLSEDSDLSFKAYLDRYHRLIPTVYEEDRQTVNLDVEHRLKVGSRHKLTFGLGYRSTHDDTGGPPLIVVFDPASRTLDTYSAFGQDQIALGDFSLTVGSKFEHNEYSGFEYQPSVRLGWTPRERMYTWAAISRAVRVPTRVDEDAYIFFPPGPAVRAGNPNFQSEKLIAYEWGLRYWTEQAFSADLAVYFNDYSDLKSTEASPPPFGSADNKLEGTGHGAELNLDWHPLDNVNVRGWYAFSAINVHAKPGSTDTKTESTVEGNNPRHNAGIELKWKPAADWTLDGYLRYVSGLSNGNVPAYADLNLRAGYRVLDNLELSISGNNLLHSHHPEFGAESPTRLEASRGIFAQLDWSWE